MLSWIKFFIIVIIILLGLGFYQTYRIQNSSLTKEFLKGSFPKPVPSGMYHGSANFPVGPWQGKTFDAKAHAGYNVILGKHMIPFKTYPSQGIQDKNLKVLAIDYNIPHNIFLFHPILDEIVETKKSTYLGKLSLRIIPGYPFAVLYFWLKK